MSFGQELHELRNIGTKIVVEKLVNELKRQAYRGRSDYEFHFRPYDIWIGWFRLPFIPFPFPYLTSYWDCIDSDGSREVIQYYLEYLFNPSNSFSVKVYWSVHRSYPRFWAPKWILHVEWSEKNEK